MGMQHLPNSIAQQSIAMLPRRKDAGQGENGYNYFNINFSKNKCVCKHLLHLTWCYCPPISA
jgi:hypothetical protein